MTLNQEQQAVVDSPAKKLLCIASAGSGKSTVLCARIARLVADGADPAKFLVISYTVAASRVLQERLGDIKLGFCGTLHAFSLKLLMQHGSLVGLPKTISVCDEETAQSLLESIMSEMGCKTPMKQMIPLLKLAALIQPVKGMSRSKQELTVIEFHSRLRESGLLTFDAILFYAERLIPKMDWQFTHLFIDEANDCAVEDWALYDVMPCEDVFIVGDPDQKIMGFRGACDIFEKRCLQFMNPSAHQSEKMQEHTTMPFKAPESGYRVFVLASNYRCRAAIAEAAQRLILHNDGRFPKETNPIHPGGSISVTRCETPAAELALVLNKVTELMHGRPTSINA